MNINKNNSVNASLAQAPTLSIEEIDFLTKQPIKFIEGNFADYMWGGYHLYDMKGLPYDENSRIAAESWEISGHKKYPSRVMMPNGSIFTFMDLLKNRHLAGLILGEAVIEHFGQDFPILVKFVDVHKHMSAHLHPSAASAKALGEDDPGKEEVFIVLDLHEDAESALYLGLKDGVTRKAFEEAIDKEENILDLSHKIYVRPGEIYRIPSGVLHCWTGGSIAVEITESSDLTYRMYDFRRHRPTHIKKGLASIDYNRGQGVRLEKECRGLWQPTEARGLDIVKTHNALRVERLSADSAASEPVKIDSRGTFEVLMGIEGLLEIVSLSNDWVVNLSKGRSILIPSKAGSYRIRGLDRENSNCALRISMKIPGGNGES
ncbi:MAG: class I mannose-6-phosphate isomerase [Candidatus Omnitrophica bacterium]|jgi:mannose-6-phosphate isomerase|nr:class I mannose-6-phosphate isomerase [Candidatus Omnitrophota bacterium]